MRIMAVCSYELTPEPAVETETRTLENTNAKNRAKSQRVLVENAVA